MNSDNLDLVALVGSRICHDLISPLGAIGNGVELFELSGGQSAEELSLISRSVDSANAKIKLFRIAFGTASAGQSIAASEVANILSALSDAGKVNFYFDHTGDIPRQDAKLIFLSVQCLETVLPFGGEVWIDGSPGNWRITARADRFRGEPGLWEIAMGKADTAGLSASAVHFALMAYETQRQGRQLQVRFGDREIQLVV